MNIHDLQNPRSFRALVAAGILANLLGIAACVQQVDGTEPAGEATPQGLAAQGDDRAHSGHHGHHFRGPAPVVLRAALEQGDLSVDQEDTVQVILEELELDHEAKEQMREQLRASAVEIVRSGTADSKQFDQAVDQAVGAIEERVRAGSDAMKELHAMLEPDQRSLVADALRDHLAERWPENHRYGHHHAKHRKGFKRLAAHLMLTTFQIDKLKALKQQLKGKEKRMAPTREEVLAMIDAFEGEDFEEVLDEFNEDKRALLRERMARAGEHTDTVLSLLTGGQRDLLAELIERGPRAVLLGEEDQQSDTAAAD